MERILRREVTKLDWPLNLNNKRKIFTNKLLEKITKKKVDDVHYKVVVFFFFDVYKENHHNNYNYVMYIY